MFGLAMRNASLKLHTHSITHSIAPAPPTTLGFAKYLAEQREIHTALQRFPVRTTTNLAGAADIDLLMYEDGLSLVEEPYVSKYAVYLHKLPLHVLGCHWFNAVFALLAGGGLIVAKQASPVLPPKFLETSMLYTAREDVADLKEQFEREAQSWTTAQRVACLRETSSAFAHQVHVQSVIGT